MFENPVQADQRRRRVAWRLLTLSPLASVVTLLLARLGEASWHDSLAMAVAALIISLTVSAAYRVRGVRPLDDAELLKVVLRNLTH